MVPERDVVRDVAIGQDMILRTDGGDFAVAGGAVNRHVFAERIVIAEQTTKTYVGRILAKLSLRDRAQAVVVAYETGLVRPSRDPS